MSTEQMALTAMLAENVDDIIERIFEYKEKSEGE